MKTTFPLVGMIGILLFQSICAMDQGSQQIENLNAQIITTTSARNTARKLQYQERFLQLNKELDTLKKKRKEIIRTLPRPKPAAPVYAFKEPADHKSNDAHCCTIL